MNSKGFNVGNAIITMKIGFPNNPRKDIIKEIEWIGKNGFEFIDVFLEEDGATPEKVDVKKVRNLLRKYNIGVVGHTAWYLPVGSPIKSLREAAVAEAKKYFAVFSKIGVKYVTIHANWPPGMFSSAEGVDFQAETLRKLVSVAKKYRLEVMLEPIDTPHDSIKNVSSILRKVPGLHLHLDIGHSNLFGRKPEQFIRKFHRKIRHIHMHDNDGTADQHLPIGAGEIDWKKLVKVLKKYYGGTITLEVFSRDRKHVLASKSKLEKLWKHA